VALAKYGIPFDSHDDMENLPEKWNEMIWLWDSVKLEGGVWLPDDESHHQSNESHLFIMNHIELMVGSSFFVFLLAQI